MTDIATVVFTNGEYRSYDWQFGVQTSGNAPVLYNDDGLYTAVIISLLTDRQAAADDFIPDAPTVGPADRRGWWGDTATDDTVDGEPDLIGSRLWLLTRCKLDGTVAPRAQIYAEEALAWMIEDGVAGSVVATAKEQPGALKMNVTISRTLANGAPINHSFDIAWSVTGQTLALQAIAITDMLSSEGGIPLTDELGQTIEL
jgi:phage gp46-like protein